MALITPRDLDVLRALHYTLAVNVLLESRAARRATVSPGGPDGGVCQVPDRVGGTMCAGVCFLLFLYSRQISPRVVVSYDWRE